MFDQMRKNTKTVLWITVVAFLGLIFLAWGADFSVGKKQAITPGSIGSVNGRPIQNNQYDLLIMQARENYKQQSGGREPDERTDAQIRSQAWNDLVQDMILREEAERRGIRVNDDELREVILNQPPAEMQSVPQFQTDGRFDLAKYQAFLRNPNFDTRAIEAQYRRSLPLQKLQLQVVSAVSVSDEELWESYLSQNEKLKVEYVMLPAAKFSVDDASIGQADLESYYQGHKQNYRLPPQAVLQYVSVPRRPTQTDSLNLIEQGRAILQELAEGEDFLTLVDAYSEASPQMRGGDQAMLLSAEQITEPAVRQAAFSLPVGGVSEVLSARNGIHILKVMDRQETPTGPQVKLADVFLPLEPSPETLSTLREQVAEIRQQAAQRSLDELAAEFGHPVRETAPFGEGSFIPGLGSVPELTAWAFTATPGDVAVPTETADGWVVARLKERKAERVPELAEIADRVRTETADSLRVLQAAQAAEGMLGQAQAGTPLAVIAQGDPRATFDTTDPFARIGFVKGIGNDPNVIGPLFAANQVGVVPKVLKGRTGAFICRIVEVTPADRAGFDATKESLRRSLMQRRQSQVFNEWLAGLKKQADIQDYRWGVTES